MVTERNEGETPQVKPRPILLGVLLVISIGLFAAAVIWAINNTAVS